MRFPKFHDLSYIFLKNHKCGLLCLTIWVLEAVCKWELLIMTNTKVFLPSHKPEVNSDLTMQSTRYIWQLVSEEEIKYVDSTYVIQFIGRFSASRYKIGLNPFVFFHPPVDNMFLWFHTCGLGFASGVSLALTASCQLVCLVSFHQLFIR